MADWEKSSGKKKGRGSGREILWCILETLRKEGLKRERTCLDGKKIKKHLRVGTGVIRVMMTLLKAHKARLALDSRKGQKNERRWETIEVGEKISG